MRKVILKYILSDSWVAHGVRLLAIVLAFFSVYGKLPEFEIWFNTNVGATIYSKLIAIFSAFSLSAWYVSSRDAQLLEDNLAETKQLLNSAEAQISEYEGHSSETSPEAAFNDAIVLYVRALQENKRYQHILRVQDALSRYLWVEGLLRARASVGEAAEDAAARLGLPEKQVAALVDDSGWTLVALNNLNAARNKIKLGLSISQANKYPYWIAKAHRHLMGIAAIEHEFELVREHYSESEKACKEISDSTRKTEMLAGIEYGRSVAFLLEGKYEEALQAAEKSEKARLKRSDPTRTIRMHALKGKILLAIGDTTSRGNAKAHFLRGLEEARTMGRRDEVIRNLNGLIAVADKDNDPDTASQLRSEVRALIAETPVPYEIQDQI